MKRLRGKNMKLYHAEESEGNLLTRLHAEGAHVLSQLKVRAVFMR
jgi:hypothetical protein